MSLQIQGVSYIHPNKDILFQNISFSVSSGEKCAIVGNNGVGKSTLMSIIAGKLSPATGTVLCDDSLYIIPQHFGQFNNLTVAEALGVAEKLKAIKKCVARIAMGNLRDKSESTASRLDKVQQEKLDSMKKQMRELRSSINDHAAMKIDIGVSALHGNKRLVEARNVTFKYEGRNVMWQQTPLNLTILSGERIRVLFI